MDSILLIRGRKFAGSRLKVMFSCCKNVFIPAKNKKQKKHEYEKEERNVLMFMRSQYKRVEIYIWAKSRYTWSRASAVCTAVHLLSIQLYYRA